MFIFPFLVCPRRPGSPGGTGRSCLAFRDFSSLTTHLQAAYYMRPISFLIGMSPLESRSSQTVLSTTGDDDSAQLIPVVIGNPPG